MDKKLAGKYAGLTGAVALVLTVICQISLNKKFLTLPSEYLWLLKNTEKKLLLSELKRRAEVLS